MLPPINQVTDTDAPKDTTQAPEPDASPAQDAKPQAKPTPTPDTINASADADPVTQMRRHMAAETRRVEASLAGASKP